MTKCVADLATLLDVLVDPSKTNVPNGGYVSCTTGSWSGLRVGTLDPRTWNFPPSKRKVLDESMESQLVRFGALRSVIDKSSHEGVAEDE